MKTAVHRLIEPLIEGDEYANAELMRVLSLNQEVSRGFCEAVERHAGLNSANIRPLIAKYEAIRIRTAAFDKEVVKVQNCAKALHLSCDLLYNVALKFTGTDESIMERLEHYYVRIAVVEYFTSRILAFQFDPCGDFAQSISDHGMYRMSEKLITELSGLSDETNELILVLKQATTEE